MRTPIRPFLQKNCGVCEVHTPQTNVWGRSLLSVLGQDLGQSDEVEEEEHFGEVVESQENVIGDVFLLNNAGNGSHEAQNREDEQDNRPDKTRFIRCRIALEYLPKFSHKINLVPL